jgi:hypothetical protein
MPSCTAQRRGSQPHLHPGAARVSAATKTPAGGPCHTDGLNSTGCCRGSHVSWSTTASSYICQGPWITSFSRAATPIGPWQGPSGLAPAADRRRRRHTERGKHSAAGGAALACLARRFKTCAAQSLPSANIVACREPERQGISTPLAAGEPITKECQGHPWVRNRPRTACRPSKVGGSVRARSRMSPPGAHILRSPRRTPGATYRGALPGWTAASDAGVFGPLP